MTYASMDDYLAAQPAAARAALARVRAIVRRTLPQAEEAISYGIPAFRLHGRVAIFMAGWARHYAIYPVVPEVAKALGAKVAGYQLSKGTIRFPLDAPVPATLVAAIARLLAARAKAAAGAPAPGSRGQATRRATATSPTVARTSATATAAARTRRAATRASGAPVGASRAATGGTTRRAETRTTTSRQTTRRQRR